ncbi:transcription factor BHLH148-like isoform X2 [Panicum virgatum]|uniref:transcription factor BHLH148-like isoform X2 n=1 Tax=Panicum virgatum TaxID=38727 RepID=UPI0019D50454|nr:transcription factor BHLH148-like isoform X2 [Panicum virgatum]
MADDDDEDYLMSLFLVLPPELPAGSAFEAYQRRRRRPTLLESRLMMTGRGRSGAGANVHRRMFGYLRRVVRRGAAAGTVHPAPADDEATTLVRPPPSQPPRPRSSSRFRHIMRERLRRERLSQGFADLHALLPPGASSKGGKNDIVGAAVGYIRELEGRKGWLRARNQELLERAATRWSGGAARNAAAGGDMVVKVRAESQDRAAAVDAFETVLLRLKAMAALRVTDIRSCFCTGGMWMNVGVEGQVSTREVDEAITNALMGLAGNEPGRQDPRSIKPSFSCQVERGVPIG